MNHTNPFAKETNFLNEVRRANFEVYQFYGASHAVRKQGNLFIPLNSQLKDV